jgi:hypothetical protein
MTGMTEHALHPVDLRRPETLLDNFEDSAGAAQLLNRSRSTVSEMAARGLITPYRVGAVVLYWRPEVERIAAALKTLAVKFG